MNMSFVRVPEVGKSYQVIYHEPGHKYNEGTQEVISVSPKTLQGWFTVVTNLGQHSNQGVKNFESGRTVSWWRTYHDVDEPSVPLKLIYVDCSASVCYVKGQAAAAWNAAEEATKAGFATTFGFSSTGSVWQVTQMNDMWQDGGGGGTAVKDVIDHIGRVAKSGTKIDAVIVTDEVGTVTESDRATLRELCHTFQVIVAHSDTPAIETYDNYVINGDVNQQEETEMTTTATLYEYRVHDDETVHATGEVLVPGGATDPRGTARDLAVADFVKKNTKVSITDVTVVVRPFSRS